MTGPGESGASRLRIAGVALLGVAAIAAVVGLISLGGQGTSSAPAASPTSTVAPAPGDTAAPGASGVPGGPGAVPSGAPGADGAGQAGQPGQPGAPGALAPGAAPPVTEALPPVAAAPPIVPGDGSGSGSGGGAGGGAASFATVPVRVYNNSTIRGLAETAAGQIKGRGFDVVETGNYAQGVIPVSTAYYRPGSGEQGAAEALAASFGIRAEPRFPGIEGASPGVIVIATNNWGQNAQKGS